MSGAVPPELLAHWLDHYGRCDRDHGKQNDCYWGKDSAGRENGCLRVGWKGRACKHWTPISENELVWLAAAHVYSAPSHRDCILTDMTNSQSPDRAALADELAQRIERVSTYDGYLRVDMTVEQIKSVVAALRSPSPYSGAAGEAVGATHVRRPEYITAWLFDGVSTMPLWLIEKYHSRPVPEKHKDRYATAIDGSFWRWFDRDKFEEMFVPTTLPRDAVAGEADELLSCPFCGGAAMTSDGEHSINIHCSECDAEGGWFRGDACFERAVHHWNARSRPRNQESRS